MYGVVRSMDWKVVCRVCFCMGSGWIVDVEWTFIFLPALLLFCSFALFSHYWVLSGCMPLFSPLCQFAGGCKGKACLGEIQGTCLTSSLGCACAACVDNESVPLAFPYQRLTHYMAEWACTVYTPNTAIALQEKKYTLPSTLNIHHTAAFPILPFPQETPPLPKKHSPSRSPPSPPHPDPSRPSISPPVASVTQCCHHR